MNDTDKAYKTIVKYIESCDVMSLSYHRLSTRDDMAVDFSMDDIDVFVRCFIQDRPEVMVNGWPANFSCKQKAAICRAAKNAVDKANENTKRRKQIAE